MTTSNDPIQPIDYATETENIDDTYASDCGTTNINEPFVGQEFNSIDEAYSFYKAYALEKGFGTRKSSSTISKATNELIWKKFECDKSGFKKISDEAGQEVIRHRETRVGCKAKLDIRRNKQEQWVVTGITKEHNHELDTVEISIRDPHIVRTKGRPKIARRITSGLENSQIETKKRTCGSCGGKGHYATTCTTKGKDLQ